MSTLDELFEQLDIINDVVMRNTKQVKDAIQAHLNTRWKAWEPLHQAISRLDCGGDGVTYYEDHNDLYSCTPLPELAEMPERERRYFEQYMLDQGGYLVGWGYSTLILYHGVEHLVILDRHGPDNGVWRDWQRVIPESDYYIDGTVDVALRNRLIEQYKERTGYDHDVFRANHHGELDLVDIDD